MPKIPTLSQTSYLLAIKNIIDEVTQWSLKSTKTMNTHQNTKGYIKGKSSLFILLNKSLNLSLLSVCRPQYFISHTTSLLIQRSVMWYRLTQRSHSVSPKALKNVIYVTPFPRNVSLGHLRSTLYLIRCYFEFSTNNKDLATTYLINFINLSNNVAILNKNSI